MSATQLLQLKGMIAIHDYRSFNCSFQLQIEGIMNTITTIDKFNN